MNPFKGLTNTPNNAQKLNNLGTTLNQLSNMDDVKKALSIGNIDKDFAKLALSTSRFKDNTDGVLDAISNLSAAGSTKVSSLNSAFKGLGTVFKTFITSPLGIGTAVAAGTMGIMALIDHYTTTYDEAQQKAQAASQNYTNAKSEYDSVNQHYQTNNNRVKELQALKNAGNLSSSGNNELTDLLSTDQTLEAQVNSKEQLMKLSQKESNKEAKKALNKADVSLAGLYDDEGKKYAKGTKDYDKHSDSMTDAEAIDASIQKVDDYKKSIKELKAEQRKTGNNDNQKEIDQYQTAIDALEKDMSSRVSSVSSHMNNLTNKSSSAYKDAQNALASYNMRGKSKDEKQTQSVKSYFDTKDNSAMGDYLTKLSQSGKLTAQTFSRLGISAKDLGIDSIHTAVNYFNDLALAAEKAAGSVNKVDGSFNGIEKAFGTENAGDTYEETANYVQKAKEMFDKGLWNTDDVKSVGKLIGADPNNIKETFAAKYQEALKYFTFDEESGAMTEDGVNNFINDYNDKLGKNNGDFESTSEAANSMGITAEAFEILKGRAQDHGTDFGDMVNSSEELASGKDALEGIKEIWDSLSADDQKGLSKIFLFSKEPGNLCFS